MEMIVAVPRVVHVKWRTVKKSGARAVAEFRKGPPTGQLVWISIAHDYLPPLVVLIRESKALN